MLLKKNSCVQDKVETVENRQNQCKKIKFFIFKSNFSYDGAKKWPPNLVLWAPALSYLQVRPNASQQIELCDLWLMNYPESYGIIDHV